jgi:hypothetical protein
MKTKNKPVVPPLALPSLMIKEQDPQKLKILYNSSRNVSVIETRWQCKHFWISLWNRHLTSNK